jgi:hypothetical protein
MNAAQLDFQQLRIKHILYKSKVRSALYGGTFDADFFSQSGPLNCWFNSTGLVKYGNEPEMLELARLNQDLNKTATDLYELYNDGNIDQAHDGLKIVERKSEHFLNLLSQLESKLKE